MLSSCETILSWFSLWAQSFFRLCRIILFPYSHFKSLCFLNLCPECTGHSCSSDLVRGPHSSSRPHCRHAHTRICRAHLSSRDAASSLAPPLGFPRRSRNLILSNTDRVTSSFFREALTLLLGVLVSSSCCNKDAADWVPQKQQTFIYFLQFWRWEVQDAGASRCSVWWEPSSWFSEGHLPILGERGTHVPLVSLLIRTLIPSWGLHPHELIASQRPHLLIPSHWD